MTTVKDALADLLQNPDLSVAEAAERHLSPDFRERTNGHWVDRAGFLTGVDELRRTAREITITVLDEVIDGNRYADRHIIDVQHVDGRRSIQEVYLFATLDAVGRLERIEEAAFALDASRPSLG